MAKEKEIIALSESTKKNIEILNAFKAQVDEMSNNCLLIQVNDESTLMVGQQNLSKANTMLKAIEDKIKAIRKPLNDELKQISAIGSPLTESLEKAVKHLKSELANWEAKRLAEQAAKQAEIDRQLEEQRKAAEAEEKRKADIRTYINERAMPILKKCYEECISVDMCDQKLQFIEKNYKPIEFFQEFGKEAYDLKNNYVELIKSKREQLSSANTMSEAEIELAMEKERIAIERQNMALREAELKAKEEQIRLDKVKAEQEALAEAEKAKIDAEAALNKTKGVRYTWGFKVVDIEKVPLHWLMVDEDKVNDFIKVAKKDLMDGQILDGIKFIKKMGIVG